MIVVAAISDAFQGLIVSLCNIASLILLVYVVLDVARNLTTIPDALKSFHEGLAKICEPVLEPIRRRLPPMGGIDFSPLIVILALQFISLAVS